MPNDCDHLLFNAVIIESELELDGVEDAVEEVVDTVVDEDELISPELDDVEDVVEEVVDTVEDEDELVWSEVELREVDALDKDKEELIELGSVAHPNNIKSEMERNKV